MKLNVSGQSIGAEMITVADGSDFAGSVSVLVTIDNGAQTAGGGTAPAYEGNGYHSYSPTQAETNGDHIAFTFTGSGAITVTVQVYTQFPQTGDGFALVNHATYGVAQLVRSSTPANALVVDAAGLADGNMVKAGPTGAGTSQSAVDLGGFVASILTDTAEIGTAGAGLSNINLPNQTMNITGSLSGSVGSVTGAVGSVTGSVGSVTGSVGSINGVTFPGNFADLSITVTAGEIALKAATQTSIDAIEADTDDLQVNQGAWATAIGFSTHTAANVWSVATRAITEKTGFSLSTAGILAIWHQATSAIADAGSIGKHLTDEITSVRMATLTDWINGGRLDVILDAVKTVTDAITATSAAALSRAVNLNLTGTATSGTTTTLISDVVVTSNNQFKGRTIIFANDTTTSALQGQATDITGSTAADNTLTFSALTAVVANTDTFEIV